MLREEMYLVRTDATCLDKSLGLLLGAYVLGELRADARCQFERHASECVACGTALTNWRQLMAAATVSKEAEVAPS